MRLRTKSQSIKRRRRKGRRKRRRKRRKRINSPKRTRRRNKRTRTRTRTRRKTARMQTTRPPSRAKRQPRTKRSQKRTRRARTKRKKRPEPRKRRKRKNRQRKTLSHPSRLTMRNQRPATSPRHHSPTPPRSPGRTPADPTSSALSARRLYRPRMWSRRPKTPRPTHFTTRPPTSCASTTVLSTATTMRPAAYTRCVTPRTDRCPLVCRTRRRIHTTMGFRTWRGTTNSSSCSRSGMGGLCRRGFRRLLRIR